MAGPADIGAGSSLCGRSIAALTVVFVAAVQHLLHTAAVLAAPVGTFCRFPPLCASRSGRIVRSVILRAAVIRMHMNAVFRQLITAFRMPVAAGCPLASPGIAAVLVMGRMMLTKCLLLPCLRPGRIYRRRRLGGHQAEAQGCRH